MKKWIITILLLSPVVTGAQECNLEPGELNSYLPRQEALIGFDEFDPFQLELVQKQNSSYKDEEENLLREQVIGILGYDRVGGVVKGRGSICSKILINGWVFGVVDEICFPDETGKLVPPIEGKSLLLISINDRDFEVRVRSDDGSETTTVCVPLDSYFG